MADVQPLRALHYDTSVVGDLAAVTAPPYDVIDPEQRAALLARSPFNIVAIDLPQSEAGSDADRYATAAELLESWRLQGALVRDEQPAIWAHTQEYEGPDGRRLTRRGFFCRVRIEDYGPGRVRPHERTHPGPKEDRLRLTRATRTNVSPIFSLYSDPSRAAWSALAAVTEGPPWGEVSDGEGTTHRLWRETDADAIAAVQAAASGSELLIADGHHRYETMQAYAQEVGGEGDHRYILMCLVALEDPGLTVFPTHRLVGGLDEARTQALTQALERDFEIAEVPVEQIDPPWQGAHTRTPLQVGYIDHRDGRALRLTLKDQAIADEALPGRIAGLSAARHRRARGAAAQGRAGPERRGHLASARAVLCALDRGGAVAGARRRVRRSLLHAPDARGSGQRDRRGGRKHATEVDVLLSQAADGSAAEPACVIGRHRS